MLRNVSGLSAWNSKQKCVKVDLKVGDLLTYKQRKSGGKTVEVYLTSTGLTIKKETAERACIDLKVLS